MNEFTEKLEPHLQRMVDHGVNGLDIMHGELKNLMLIADTQLEEAQARENETEEAIDSMERKYWEGVGDAYAQLYKLTYDLSFAIAGMRNPNNE